MEEEKKRKIEDQLRLLVAEADLKRGGKRPIEKTGSSIKVIRRRKGQPDLQIAWIATSYGWQGRPKYGLKSFQQVAKMISGDVRVPDLL